MAIDGQTMHKQMLMMQTSEPNCEFMKITTSDYSRVIEVSNYLVGLWTKKISMRMCARPPTEMCVVNFWFGESISFS